MEFLPVHKYPINVKSYQLFSELNNNFKIKTILNENLK